jgi:Haem-NO-binding
MKGLVFREFLDMVEQRFSPEAADRMIAASGVASGGAYTSVGTYHHSEMVQLVTALAAQTGRPVAGLMRTFGHHLAQRFAALYPSFFAAKPTMFDFLASVDAEIHVEVRKLYPDAELPRFEVRGRDDDGMTLVYFSSRHLGDLAHGLIEGVALHYGEHVHVQSSAAADGSVIFEVQPHVHVTAA